MVSLYGVVRYPWKRTPALRPSRKAIPGEMKKRKVRKVVKKRRKGAGIRVGAGLRLGRGINVGGGVKKRRRRRRKGKGISL